MSAEDGHEIFSCIAARHDVTVSPVIDPIDIAIQSVLSLLKCRDIPLARTEYEVGREVVLRLLIAQRNISQMVPQEAQLGLDSVSNPAMPEQYSEGGSSSATRRCW